MRRRGRASAEAARPQSKNFMAMAREVVALIAGKEVTEVASRRGVAETVIVGETRAGVGAIERTETTTMSREISMTIVDPRKQNKINRIRMRILEMIPRVLILIKLC